MKIQISSPAHYFTDLRLPWSKHLNEWDSSAFVSVAHGIHRNVVKFIANGDTIYALKELNVNIARKEYETLRALEELGLPVVEAVGLVSDRHKINKQQDSSELDMSDRGLLITRFLESALPYRIIIERGVSGYQLNQMIDSLAELLVRLHLSKFYWGDCSLSNALFKRDAGALAAYLVDAETGEILPEINDQRRAYDLELAFTNIAGDLMDLEAGLGGLPGNADPIEVAERLTSRYEMLWDELTRDEVFSVEEQYRVEKRIERLNELGFDVEEMQLDAEEGGDTIRMRVQVVEPWHHRRKLQNLTGMLVEENQARRLLNDLYRYRARMSKRAGRQVPEPVAAFGWLSERFQPAISRIPEHLRGGLVDAELFHEMLEHRWYLSEQMQCDVGFEGSVDSYINKVLVPRHASGADQLNSPF